MTDNFIRAAKVRAAFFAKNAPMDGYHPKTPKPLPSAIHELQRILYDAGDARRAADDRMRRMFSEPGDFSLPAADGPSSRQESVCEAELSEHIRVTIER